jgi:hypothetical protein
MSPGFSPLMILSTKTAARRNCWEKSTPYAINPPLGASSRAFAYLSESKGIERSRWRGIELVAGMGVPTTFLPSAGGTSNE